MKELRKAFAFFLVLSAVFASAGHAVADDFQYWSRYSLKLIDTKYVDYSAYGELRATHDVSNTGLWYMSQRISVDAHRNLGLGANYTYLENEVTTSRSTDEFKYQHRLELEVTPRWQYKDGIKLSNRNRVEFRWIEDQGSDNTRYRQMWTVDLPLPGIRFLKSIYANNELFFDFHRQRFNENRLTPMGVVIPLPGKCSLQVFYMIQSVKKSGWSSNQIAGTQLNIAF